jgi:ubiquinone/menaquinone biosynthesis C-methylase UbiE
MNDVWPMMKKENIPSSLEIDDVIMNLLKPSSHILDLGCGNGNLCKDLSARGFNLYGIDCSPAAIENAKHHDSKSKYFVMNAHELSFESKYFDFIIVKALFTVVVDSHMRNKIMSEICRVIKNECHVYIADFAQTWWNKDYYQRYMENYPLTGEYGLFKVLNQQDDIEYFAKHFAPKEMVDLYSEYDFEMLMFDTVRVQTQTGNKIDGYKILLRKIIDGVIK